MCNYAWCLPIGENILTFSRCQLLEISGAGSYSFGMKWVISLHNSDELVSNTCSVCNSVGGRSAMELTLLSMILLHHVLVCLA